MTELTRRPSPDSKGDSWMIYHGDVQVGHIGKRAGVPNDLDQWGWNCGFYPRSHAGHRFEGTAETFERARSDFDTCWRAYLPRCNDADFEEYRRQRDFTAWKYQMRDTGCQMPTAMTSGRSRCFCGAEIDIANTDRHIIEHHPQKAIP